jgi:hypothetical protein
MYQLKIKLYKPKYSGIAMAKLNDQVDIETKVTTITESSLRRGYKNVPVMPKIHAEALIALGKLNNKHLLPLATYLALHLTKDNPDTIKLLVGNIMDEYKISENTVLRVLKLLEDLTYIKSIGKSAYYLSPRLAFYGSSIEWSLALQYEEEGKTPEEFRLAKISINKQIKENETLAGIQQ